MLCLDGREVRIGGRGQPEKRHTRGGTSLSVTVKVKMQPEARCCLGNLAMRSPSWSKMSVLSDWLAPHAATL